MLIPNKKYFKYFFRSLALSLVGGGECNKVFSASSAPLIRAAAVNVCVFVRNVKSQEEEASLSRALSPFVIIHFSVIITRECLLSQDHRTDFFSEKGRPIIIPHISPPADENHCKRN